ncbi:tetratricopeptide repeat protein [Actinoplanes sp. NBRC 103695]|uniref:tetratricopeptide repeat protein n=1 Tax=Actinoplanes sp. NBRC 103695 TaxID=3032202 RepID=UPI0025539760|nr:tetratricopeptide repeat protein [Actinoplanes sp. NBRC 103695]GLY99232.1 hypothetical protein Acsp02_64850 [Actinoplanes sp. NBRC 103695]
MTRAADGSIASGERPIGIGTNTGIANSGDNPRFAHLDAGALKSPHQVPPDGFWSVPRRPSRVFVGRDTVMGNVAATLGTGVHGVIGQSFAGLGGVGKTEVALHHAHSCRDRYTGVWWVGADSRANLTTGLAALAHRLAPVTSLLPDEQAEEWARAWLHHHSGWLLVLDNVEDPNDIASLLSGVVGGHVLVTTRREVDWDMHGLTPIRLGVLSEAEAVQMMFERTRQRDDAAATAIASYLGCLPLALEQAAAFINHHHLSMAAYHDRLEAQTGALLAVVAPGMDAQRAVTRVWEITLEALTISNPAAIEILRVLAWLAPDDVPRDMMTALIGGDTAADVALGLLSSYSMITLDARTVSIHRLVQTVLRLAPTPSADQLAMTPSDQAIQLINNAIPENPDSDPVGWPRWRDLLPHVTALSDHLRCSAGTTLGRLLNQTALFESGQGLFQQAEVHNSQALAITEAALGPDHPDVAICLVNLAGSYSALGRPAEAVPHEQRALAITEAALGPDHPDVAICLVNLAGSYSALGRPAEAVPHEQRALAITEAALGPAHPSVATCLGNLASSYRDLGRPAEALPLSQRALAITEAALGPDHPDIAIRLGNLASSYRDLGRPAEAVPHEQRALAITEATFGPDHPDIAIRLGNLANSYSALGRAAEALSLSQRALTIAEAALGPYHPTIATCLGNLAANYAALGRPAEALPLSQRALTITEAALGPDHPDVAIWLSNLARSYRDLGRPTEAVPLFQRASAIAEAALGPDHPTIAIRLSNLASSYRDLGRPGEAVPHEQRALAITEAALGPDHPDVGICLVNLAANYAALGRPAEAVPHEQRALAITEAALGPDHPTIATCLGNLAANYAALGRPAEAVPHEQRALAITEAALGPDHPDIAIRLGNLANSYSALGRPAEALTLCRKAVRIAGQAMPNVHPIAMSLNEFLWQLLREAKDRDRSG